MSRRNIRISTSWLSEDTPYDTGPMNLRVPFLITMGTTTDMSEEQAYDIFKAVVENVETVAEILSGNRGAWISHARLSSVARHRCIPVSSAICAKPATRCLSA